MQIDHTSISNEIMTIYEGPNKVAKSFFRSIINGIIFHITTHEENRLSQNNGVVNTLEVGRINYYGRLKDNIKLNY